MYKLIVIFFSFVSFLNAQKVVKKAILNHDITAVQIDAANCFNIKMNTTETDELLVKATIDGEYKQDLVLNINEEGTNVLVSAGFTPSFTNPNDKLSAHKVVSIALEIHVPENRNVQVNGASCNLLVVGNYKHLKISLNDGICTLNNVGKEVMVTTQSGDINIAASSAVIKANSKYGQVQKNDIPKGVNNFTLNTTTGNINLVRSQ